jgi:hypothetical protein
MRTFLKSKKGIAALIATLVVAISAVGAFAYFTTTGSGSGTATVGTSSNLVLTGTASATLYPGTSSPVSFTALNNSPGHQQLGTIYLASVEAYPTALDRTNDTNVISGCGTVDAGNAANAGASDFYMQDVLSNQDFPAGASAQAVTAGGTLVMNNLSVSQNPCKNAFLKLDLSTR